MSEPRRLLDDPSILAIDRTILVSAEDDAPSEQARRAARIALGIGVSGGVAALAGKSVVVTSKLSGWAVVLKVVAVLAVAGGATAIVAATILGKARSQDDERPSATPAATVTARASAAPVAPSPSPSAEPGVVRVDDLPPAAPSARALAGDPKTKARTTDEAPSMPSMQEEIAALDRARSRLAGGDARGALEELLAYEKTHSNGALAPEAASLQFDAHVALGESEAARRVARRYVQRYPNGPEAPRLRRVLDGPDRPAEWSDQSDRVPP